MISSHNSNKSQPNHTKNFPESIQKIAHKTPPKFSRSPIFAISFPSSLQCNKK